MCQNQQENAASRANPANSINRGHTMRETYKLTIESRNLVAMSNAMKKISVKILRCCEEGAPMEGCLTEKGKFPGTEEDDYSVTWEMEE